MSDRLHRAVPLPGAWLNRYPRRPVSYSTPEVEAAAEAHYLEQERLEAEGPFLARDARAVPSSEAHMSSALERANQDGDL